MRRVYFIKPIGMDGPVKIGHSFSPDRRRSSLELWSPFPLEIVAEIEGDGILERRFHALFAANHVHHEWFKPSPELTATITAINAGTFDVATLPLAQHLPRKPKDLSYITPEWRIQHGEQIRRAHAWRKERAAKTITGARMNWQAVAVLALLLTDAAILATHHRFRQNAKRYGQGTTEPYLADEIRTALNPDVTVLMIGGERAFHKSELQHD